MRCTKAVIYSENLKNNVNQIKNNLKEGVKLCVAVKANAYGNGALECAKIYEELKVDYMAIATVEEGRFLRENGITTPLLLLSLADPNEFESIVKYGITPLVYEEEYFSRLNEEACKQAVVNPVFLAIDTGMGRIGCHPEEALKVSRKLQGYKNISQKGVITHFAVSDSIKKSDIKYTKKQFSLFMKAIESMKQNGIEPGIRTCAASAASIAFPEMQLDMVRPGIILYGYYADQVTKEYLEKSGKKLELEPVMQFETKVSSVRLLKKGESVSYGRTWKCKKDTYIGVLPAGYADGLLRRNAKILKVSINGTSYPVVGRICMDQCMIDLGSNEKNVKAWDKAIIFGPKSKGSFMTADDIARKTGTISYEVMTAISSRVKREVQ